MQSGRVAPVDNSRNEEEEEGGGKKGRGEKEGQNEKKEGP